MFRKKKTLRLSDAGAHEFVEAMGKRIGQATDDKIRRCVAPLEEQMRLLRRDLDAMRQMEERKSDTALPCEDECDEGNCGGNNCAGATYGREENR